MDEIDLLPKTLREQSLSDREVVLPYQEALQALDLFTVARRPLLGWEGWVKYPDGKHGHAPSGMGTTNIEQETGEVWEAYVHRSARFCRETIKAEQQLWDTDSTHASVKLYFCLTAKEKGRA